MVSFALHVLQLKLKLFFMIYYLLKILVPSVRNYRVLDLLSWRSLVLLTVLYYHCLVPSIMNYKVLILSSCSLVQGTLLFSAILNGIAVIRLIISSLV